jgi:phage terminase large subunit GpA-like protein
MGAASNRELARHLGVSETAVRRAEKAGRIKREPDGGWDVDRVKGRDQDTALLLSVSRADAGGKRRGLRVWSVGTPVAKGELYRWLKLEWPTEEALKEGASYPPGACHFPHYGEEYFKQLTAERLVTRIVKGFPRGSWKEPGRRNEALDCRVYARAAAAIYGLDRFEERHWRRMEEALARTVERDDPESASPRGPVGAPAGAAGDPERLHGTLKWRALGMNGDRPHPVPDRL